MKNITFLIAFLLLFKPLFPVVEYAFDYDYISKVLCVNKEKRLSLEKHKIKMGTCDNKEM